MDMMQQGSPSSDLRPRGKPTSHVCVESTPLRSLYVCNDYSYLCALSEISIFLLGSHISFRLCQRRGRLVRWSDLDRTDWTRVFEQTSPPYALTQARADPCKDSLMHGVKAKTLWTIDEALILVPHKELILGVTFIKSEKFISKMHAVSMCFD